jgi:hypothetical protein
MLLLRGLWVAGVSRVIGAVLGLNGYADAAVPGASLEQILSQAPTCKSLAITVAGRGSDWKSERVGFCKLGMTQKAPPLTGWRDRS